MRSSVSFLLVLLITGHAASAFASSQADAREIARLNNCPPKKIEVYSQSLGSDSRTVYRVDCTMPKSKDEAAKPSADTMLVQCDGTLCTMLRPLAKNDKK